MRNTNLVFWATCMATSLAACGGGGGSTATTPSTSTLSGLAATGAALANSPVSARCAAGPLISGTTSASGTFTLTLTTAHTAPCMLQVTGGTPSVSLHSFATSAGQVNITPLTDLIVAKALGSDPATAFATFDATKGSTVAGALSAAKTYVQTQVTGIAGTYPAADPLTGTFAVGDASDKVLDALAAALAAAGKTIAQLSTAAATSATLTDTVPAYLGAPTGISATTNSESQITVNWSAVTGATGYNIYRSTSASVAIIAGNKITASPATTAGAYADTSLAASTAYYYKVTAANATVTNSTASAEASATTAAADDTVPVAVGTQMGGARQGVVPTLATNPHPYAVLYANDPVTYAVLAPFAGLTQYSALTTLAGSGSTNASTDGTGLAASFNFLVGTANRIGLTTDGLNLYVTEPTRIRKIVIATGVVTTLAGSGSLGFVDGTGTAASFSAPQAMTTDGTNLYVADTANSAIRKVVIATGVVTTMAAATPFYYPDSITTDGTHLYVGDKFGTYIRKINIASGVATILTGTGYTDGPVNGIKDMTTDGTNLYITEVNTGNVLKKVNIATGTVTTIATKGASDALGYGSITTDGTYLYVSSNTSIRQITIATGVTVDREIKNAATGESQRLWGVHGMTTDGKGLFLVDSYGNAPVNGTIRKLGS